MAPDSIGTKESTTQLVCLSALVATSATARLRHAFLAPLAGAVAAFFVIGLVALHTDERGMIGSDVNRAQMLVERMYRDDIGHNAQPLEVAMEVVGHVAALRAAKAGGGIRTSRDEPALGQAEVQG